MDDRIGFLGLGIMGRPMAANLIAAGVPLTVWNRSRLAIDELVAIGATAAASVGDLFARSDVVIVMLGNESATDATLDRASGGIVRLVPGRVLVNMGTVSPGYSAGLAAEVRAADGAFVEAPVSGSRIPAEQGRLVGMVAGDPVDVERVRPLLAPLCAETTVCGEVPSALQMKLAANVFLIATVTGLAEAFAFADGLALDLEALRSIVDGGQMASPISRLKTAKLVSGDLAAQASIGDVLMNADLILDAARAAGIDVSVTTASRALYAEAADRGDGGLDMVGVARAIAARSAAHERMAAITHDYARPMLIEHRGRSPVIHPDAWVSPEATIIGAVTIAAGGRVLPGAVISAEDGEVSIGEDVVVMEHALIRGRAAHPVRIGSAVMVGPHAHVNGAVIEDEVFVATGASLFPGSRIGAGAEVRINAVVQVNTVVRPGEVVPIGWVAVGDPAQMFSPDRHEEIWAIQRELDFPGTVYGIGRDVTMRELMARQSEFYGAHRRDRVLPAAEVSPPPPP